MLVLKLSSKIIMGGKIEKSWFDLYKSDTLDLFRVYGFVDSVGHGEGTYGDYTFFKGSFKANLLLLIQGIKDTVMMSNKLFLPDIASGMLEAAHMAVIAENSMGRTQFGFTIGIKKTDNNVGYEYYAKALCAEDNSLAALEAALDTKEPALETQVGGEKGKEKPKK
jgi:hypothetical protein